MKIHYLLKGRLFNSIIHKGISLKIFLIIYLFIFIICQITSPTSAHFSDINIHNVTLSVAEDFENEKESSDEINDLEREQNE